MKFMKLGSKVDIFRVCDNSTSVASDLPSDITFNVNGHRFHLHKFPLLAKWGCLNKLIAEAQEAQSEEVLINDFPGGIVCFEMCAKYCYGITITLSPHNVGEVRCGAEFLQMTETIEKSNLIFKLEVFLDSSILRGWKDAIICLRTSKVLLPWAEDLKIIGRCIESIASKTIVDPTEVDWSFTYPRPHTASQSQRASSIERSSPAAWSSRRMLLVPRDWWLEDISELDIDLYRRVIQAIKAKGAPQELVGESIRIYTLKYFPDLLQEPLSSREKTLISSVEDSSCNKLTEISEKDRNVLETIVSLLPSEKGSCSCSFLLRLLKAAPFLDASNSTKLELARRVGLQLEEASVHDLMIPAMAFSSDTECDVDLMILILEHYMQQFQIPKPDKQKTTLLTEIAMDNHAVEHRMTEATHRSQLKVAKLIDRYLAEVARDANMPLAKFIQLAESGPDFARPVHDGLYRAIDMYLKEHPKLTKSERKKICRLMDCKKLSMDACMHAAQNDRLPLRVVVQVLFFEQVRTAVNSGLLLSDPHGNLQQPDYGEEINIPEATNGNNHSMQLSSTRDESWETVHQDFTALKGDLASIKVRIAEAERERTSMQQDATSKHMKAKSVLSAFKPEKLFNKLFASRGFSSSESSRDSISPEVVPTPTEVMTMKQQLRHTTA
jgi:hypothetical protein